MDELEEQKFQYAAESGLCPECCTELEAFINPDTKHTFCNYFECPKCHWSISEDILNKYKSADEEKST